MIAELKFTVSHFNGFKLILVNYSPYPKTLRIPKTLRFFKPEIVTFLGHGLYEVPTVLYSRKFWLEITNLFFSI